MKQAQESLPLFTIVGVWLLIFGVRLLVIQTYSSYVPFYDDWGMGGTLQEYEAGELSLSFLLQSQNGHVGIWRELLQIFIFDVNQSQWDPQLQMVINAVIWSLTGAFLICTLANNLTGFARWPAVLLVLTLWTFPTSITNAIWGVQGHSYNMILFSVLAFWYCYSTPFTRSWVWGVFFAFAVTLTMGGGILVAPAIFSVTLIRFICDSSTRTESKPTLIAMSLLSVYCIFMANYLGSSSDPLNADSLSSFLTTVFKTLSFPLHTQVAPSLIVLAPLTILGIRVLQKGGWGNRLVLFTLTLFAFTAALSITIGYARGLNGMHPTSRYFEFLQLYVVAGLVAILLLRLPIYAINKWAYRSITAAWTVAVVIGASQHVELYQWELAYNRLNKPAQENLLRNFMADKDPGPIFSAQKEHLPYPNPQSFIRFVDKVQQEDILPAALQIPTELRAEPNSTGFIENGTTRNGASYRYLNENVVGSYDPSRGGASADGSFVSQILTSKRSKLVIPVTGHLGYPDMALQILDLATDEVTLVEPKGVGRQHIEQWQNVIIDAPKKAFRIVAVDENPEKWFAFAAPRTMGKVSYLSHQLVSSSIHVIYFGLIILAFGFGIFQLKKDAKQNF